MQLLWNWTKRMTVKWNSLWDVLRINGVGVRLLDSVKTFSRVANASVRVNGEFRTSFGIHVGVREDCMMSLAFSHIYRLSDKCDVVSELCLTPKEGVKDFFGWWT